MRSAVEDAGGLQLFGRGNANVERGNKWQFVNICRGMSSALGLGDNLGPVGVTCPHCLPGHSLPVWGPQCPMGSISGPSRSDRSSSHDVAGKSFGPTSPQYAKRCFACSREQAKLESLEQRASQEKAAPCLVGVLVGLATSWACAAAVVSG